MRRTLNTSGLNTVSELPEPDIRMNPMITIAIPTANKIKFTLSKAKFLLSINLYLLYVSYLI